MKKNKNKLSIISELVSGSSTRTAMHCHPELDSGSRCLSTETTKWRRFQNKFEMTPLLSAGAFTLIELLVVVLIMGILAAVALPQYQKSVYRSRNTQLKTVVKTIGQAEHLYYLEHGEYASNFSELDIDLPLTVIPTSGGTGACNTATLGTDSARFADDYYVVLNQIKTRGKDSVSVVAYWSEGPYKCAGFGIHVRQDQVVRCLEAKSTKLYSAGAGKFCQGLERGTLNIDHSNVDWRVYDVH